MKVLAILAALTILAASAVTASAGEIGNDLKKIISKAQPWQEIPVIIKYSRPPAKNFI